MGVILYIALAAASVAAANAADRTHECAAGTRGAVLRRSCLALLALLLIVPAVLRQETGNDYLRYVEFFHLASIDSYVPTEAGFNLLVKALYRLCGYENYLLVFAVFSVWTIGNMLTVIWRQAENFTFSFFLFMMLGYYFQSFNTVRYYLALSIALLALSCILRKQYAGFVLLVLFAALFHKSALVALVLYPLALHRWTRLQRILAAGAGAGVLVFHRQVLQLLVTLYPSWEGTGDLAAGTSVSWVNIARCAAVLALAVLVKRRMARANEEEKPETVSCRALRVYINGSFLALLLYIFGWFIPEVSRICYYLTFTQIFLIPMLLDRLPENLRIRAQKDTETEARYPEKPHSGRRKVPVNVRGNARSCLTALVILGAALYFAFFLKTAYRDTIKILPYKSFLFHDLNQTPSGSIGKS